MAELPTAQEIIFERFNINRPDEVSLAGSKIIELMILFAKIHVNACGGDTNTVK